MDITDASASPAITYAVRGILSIAEHGPMGPGGRLPSERRLADDLRVSRSTLRAALGKLEDAGVISGRPQSGWYVTNPRTVSDRSSELESFTEIAARKGFTPSASVIKQEERPATLAESQRLEVAPATPVLELVRLRYLDDVPICLDASVLPAKICHQIIQEDFSRASLFERLLTVCGVFVERTSCELRAHPANPQLSDMLRLAPGDALLEIDSTGYASDGTPILISILDYRGDSYRFKADLTRNSPLGAAVPIL